MLQCYANLLSNQVNFHSLERFRGIQYASQQKYVGKEMSQPQCCYYSHTVCKWYLVIYSKVTLKEIFDAVR